MVMVNFCQQCIFQNTHSSVSREAELIDLVSGVVLRTDSGMAC